MIELLQLLLIHFCYHLGQSDRDAVSIAASLHQNGQNVLLQAQLKGAVVGAFFLDNGTFLFNRPLVEHQVARQVAHDIKHRVEHCLSTGGDIADIVLRVVIASRGVDISAKPQTILSQIAKQFVFRVILRTRERHVLQEVCQSALILLFHDRPNLVRQPEICPPSWGVVSTYIIGQPVGQHAQPQCRVHWQLLPISNQAYHYRNQCEIQMSHHS